VGGEGGLTGVTEVLDGGQDAQAGTVGRSLTAGVPPGQKT